MSTRILHIEARSGAAVKVAAEILQATGKSGEVEVHCKLCNWIGHVTGLVPDVLEYEFDKHACRVQ
jgi:hypothetical protein